MCIFGTNGRPRSLKRETAAKELFAIPPAHRFQCSMTVIRCDRTYKIEAIYMTQPLLLLAL